MSRPLEGVKVVEMGTHIAVPATARIMAEWGADVIKIETPVGDPNRMLGQTFAVPYAEDYNVLFQLGNSNKRAMALNLKTPEGLEVLFKLLAEADVFLTNTRPQGLERLGLDYPSLKAKFPGLIYAQLTGFGLTGADKDRPGFDMAAFWARSGTLVEWALAEGIPPRPTGGFGDSTTGAMILAGVLAALYKKKDTGLGDKLDIALYGTALWYNGIGVVMGQEQFGQKFPKSRYGQPLPWGTLFKTQDGEWVLVAEWDWESVSGKLYTALGRPDIAADPKYTCYEGSQTYMRELVDALNDAIAARTMAELHAIFGELDIVYEVLTNPAQVTKDPQAWENGFLREVTFKGGEKVPLPTVPVQFDSFARPEFQLAPKLGEDSVGILKELGYGDDAIRQMIDGKVIIARE